MRDMRTRVRDVLRGGPHPPKVGVQGGAGSSSSELLEQPAGAVPAVPPVEDGSGTEAGDAVTGDAQVCRCGTLPAASCEDCLIEADDRAAESEGLLSATFTIDPQQPPAPLYPLPRLISLAWRRSGRPERLQHAVGFLVADTPTHLVLCDRYDGKHPDSRRLWTIDCRDVVMREVVQ